MATDVILSEAPRLADSSWAWGGRRGLREVLIGLAWTSPWLIGATLFMFLPMVMSLYYSLTDFPLLEPPLWNGGANYARMADDPTFWRVVKNTGLYVAWTVPIGTIAGVVLAAALSGRVRFARVFQACVFIPTLVPMVAAAMVWMWLFNGEFGLINKMGQPLLAGWQWIAQAPARGAFEQVMRPLRENTDAVGLDFFAWQATPWRMPTWLVDEQWVMPSLVIMSLWSVGQSVVIYIAAIQDVPSHLYEAGRLDGMSPARQFWHITVPMVSPQILFNVIVTTINAVQVFAIPYIMFRKPDGQNPAGHFYSMYLYENAFVYNQMGYACAMAWLQLLVIVALTGLMFWASRKLVYYRGG